jgi:hypothetical protein
MPEGHLQFVSVVNLNLIALNHLGNVILIPLKKIAYI